jgi:phage-related minor tail protein
MPTEEEKTDTLEDATEELKAEEKKLNSDKKRVKKTFKDCLKDALHIAAVMLLASLFGIIIKSCK